MRLDGVYVDCAHCIVIVLPSVECDADGNRIWRVHGTLPTDDNPAWYDALVDHVVENEPKIKWLAASDPGTYPPTDSKSRDGVPRMTPETHLTSIHWSDGTSWTRVHLSAVHCYLLTHRPYIPVTVIALYLLRDLAIGTYTRMAALIGDRTRKEV